MKYFSCLLVCLFQVTNVFQLASNHAFDQFHGGLCSILVAGEKSMDCGNDDEVNELRGTT